jgi:hypothetical protein
MKEATGSGSSSFGLLTGARIMVSVADASV